LDLFVYVLMARIESASMAAHADHAGLFLHVHQPFGVREGIRNRNFHLHVLARAHALYTLARMHARRRRQDHGLQAGLFQTLSQIACEMRNSESLGEFFGRFLIPARQGDHFGAWNRLQRFQMFHAERALSRNADFHSFALAWNRITSTEFERMCGPGKLNLRPPETPQVKVGYSRIAPG